MKNYWTFSGCGGGGSWWIPRLKLYNQFKNKKRFVGGVGSYVALIGARLKADDLLYACVKSNQLDEMEQAITKEDGTIIWVILQRVC